MNAASQGDHVILVLKRIRSGGVRRPPALDALAARRRLLARLDEIDCALTTAARETADPALRETVRREAARDVAPFRGRMPPDDGGNDGGPEKRRLWRKCGRSRSVTRAAGGGSGPGARPRGMGGGGGGNFGPSTRGRAAHTLTAC